LSHWAFVEEWRHAYHGTWLWWDPEGESGDGEQPRRSVGRTQGCL